MQSHGDRPEDPPRRPAAPPPQSAPHHFGWQEPERAAQQKSGPGRGLRLGAIALSILLVAAIGTVAVVLLEGRPDENPLALPATTPNVVPATSDEPTQPPGPTPSVPGASGPVAPAPGASDWVLPRREWAELPLPEPGSPLADAQITALDDLAPVTLHGCPEPAKTPTEKAWKREVRAQWSCVHAAWVPVYEELGWPTAEPEVNFYPGEGSKSECGYLTAPAFYCSSGEGSVYFGGEHFEMAKDWDLAVNEMVNHEYGHHLQKLAGITATKLSLPATNENERRAELQATCWSAMMTIHNDAFGFNADDFASWNRRLDTMREDTLHGSRASLRYWGTRGLYADTLGDCNTWVAPKSDVA